jgi:hypothetical protein
MSETKTLSSSPAGDTAAALLGEIDARLDTLSAVGAGGLTDAEVLALVPAWDGVAAKVASVRLRVLAEIDARGVAVSLAGASTTAGWVRSASRQHPGAAHRQVTVAGALTARYSSTGQALAGGTISFGHADVITRVLDGLGPAVDPLVLAEGERVLLDHAVSVDPATLAKIGTHLSYVLDPDGERALAAEETRMAQTRQAVFVGYGAGWQELRLRAEAEAMATIKAAIDGLSAPAPCTETGLDRRTAARRRADALLAVFDVALAAGDLPPSGGLPATLVVTVPLAMLRRDLGAAGKAGPASLEDGTALSAASARRLACDAQLLPVVLGAPSVPLDIGRASRLIPAYLRRALHLRDKQCRGLHCSRPARWCQAHHIKHWVDGGLTALDNLILLCGHHHRALHSEAGWTMTWTDGVPTLAKQVPGRGPAP